MKKEQVHELLYQGLETELGGVKIYEAAIECAVNDDLRKEWTKYHEETTNHVKIMEGVFDDLGLDKTKETPGRQIVRHKAESLLKAMEMAKGSGDEKAAELVAAECVVDAEAKDHMNWELVGEVSKKASGDMAKVLKKAYEEVEKQEDHHYYHTKGWTRELWIDSLGMPAVLPPPEEEKKVETAIGAARAKHARGDMV